MSPALYASAYILTLLGGPLLIAWGWLRFVRRGRLRDRKSWPSLAALILATGSSLLAVGSMIYAGAGGGFAYYDPRLLRIFSVGVVLSSVAVIIGFIGTAFRNPLRWQAPTASLGMLIFWFLAASGE
jgi:hypothetical protein